MVRPDVDSGRVDVSSADSIINDANSDTRFTTDVERDAISSRWRTIATFTGSQFESSTYDHDGTIYLLGDRSVTKVDANGPESISASWRLNESIRSFSPLPSQGVLTLRLQDGRTEAALANDWDNMVVAEGVDNAAIATFGSNTLVATLTRPGTINAYEFDGDDWQSLGNLQIDEELELFLEAQIDAQGNLHISYDVRVDGVRQFKYAYGNFEAGFTTVDRPCAGGVVVRHERIYCSSPKLAELEIALWGTEGWSSLPRLENVGSARVAVAPNGNVYVTHIRTVDEGGLVPARLDGVILSTWQGDSWVQEVVDERAHNSTIGVSTAGDVFLLLGRDDEPEARLVTR